MIFEAAHQMGLVPLLALVVLTLIGRRRGAEWWWLAGAFGLSWLADTAAHWFDPWSFGKVYPMSQAALIGAVLMARREAYAFLVALFVVAGLSLFFANPDVLLRTVAWGSVVGIVWSRPELGLLRIALLAAFGLGLAAWMGYTLAPGWTTWGVYQSVRAVGIALFCRAAWSPQPVLRLV